MAVTRRQQAEASRTALLRAARECFVELGYEATTVAEVLRRAGMARGALYHYFPGGKQQLFAAVYADVDNLLYARLDALPAELTPLELLRRGVAAYLKLCTRTEFARLIVLEAPHALPDQRWPRARDSVGRSYARLRSTVDAAVRAGELPRLDVDILATALYGAVRELGARVCLSSDPAREARAATAAAARIIDGLAAGRPRAVSRPARPSTRTAAGRKESA